MVTYVQNLVAPGSLIREAGLLCQGVGRITTFQDWVACGDEVCRRSMLWQTLYFVLLYGIMHPRAVLDDENFAKTDACDCSVDAGIISASTCKAVILN
eukprot:5163505-Amphidinium_carterae.1